MILLADYDKMIQIIQHSKSHSLSYVADNENFDFAAVYLIYDPTERLQYIGHTGSLHKRMQEHVYGIGAGNLCSKIKRRRTISQEVREYKVKYIKFDDYRERCFSECELLGAYRPPLNFTR